MDPLQHNLVQTKTEPVYLGEDHGKHSRTLPTGLIQAESPVMYQQLSECH